MKQRIDGAEGHTYITTTAVFVAEVLKLFVSSCLCFGVDCDYDIIRFGNMLGAECVDGRWEFMKLIVPSGLYVFQNNNIVIQGLFAIESTGSVHDEVYTKSYGIKIDL